MHFSVGSLACISLMATSALAGPHKIPARAVTGAQNVVYWGQNGGNVVENNDLATYCTSEAGIDVIVLAFLFQWGNADGQLLPSGTIGQSCSITTDGEGRNCDDLAKAIDTCKSKGKKVILSLGGAVGNYSLSSRQEAEAIGQNIWDAYGNPKGGKTVTRQAGQAFVNGTIPRPFGQTFVDGWDMNIEHNSGNQFYQFLIAKLRANFASDPSNTYYITGAPQCPIPEPNMQQIITTSQFDYLFVQFYNNPGCSVNGAINYDGWKQNIANTPSSNAKIFIGVPAAPLAATGTESGSKFYLQPNNLATLTKKFSGDDAFGGIMMWSAGFSDSNVNDGCTYAQEAKRILTTGAACSSNALNITSSRFTPTPLRPSPKTLV